MKKEFNITGCCIPGKHYIVDTSAKISSIFELIEGGKYFVINRPRQYGKTTTLNILYSFLKSSPEYLPINISFEGIGEAGFKNVAVFIEDFFLLLGGAFANLNRKDLIPPKKLLSTIKRFSNLDLWITQMIQHAGKKVVLLIDEVDKSSSNQLFLDFLGMLRNKYLKQSNFAEFTFHSVILAGVHDVKTLKLKLRADAETKFNSPWNIAVDFNVDLAFSPAEIQTMLNDYTQDQQVTMDIPLIAEKLFYYTAGYPFLVSFLCKVIHEELLPHKNNLDWVVEDVDKAFQKTLKRSNTNFDSLIQNLENNQELYDYIFQIVMDGADFMYNQHDPLIQLGSIYGILSEDDGRVRIHNRIYEQIIYNYMTSKLSSSGAVSFARPTANYLDKNGNLDIQKVFLKFQQFMKEHYTND